MEQFDAANMIDAIRERHLAHKPLSNLEKLRIGSWMANVILNAHLDRGYLLAEIDRLNDELKQLKTRELARLNAHLHIDTEPRRRKTISNLPYVGIDTALGVLHEGGCIAVDLKGNEAVITAGNVAVGRLRPGTRQELDESEIPIRSRWGSLIAYSLHPVTADPFECKVGG